VFNLNLKIQYIKIFTECSIGLNLATIILGILHYFIGLNAIFGVLFSTIIILAWLFNIFLIVLDEYKTVKGTTIAKRLNLMGYGYLSYQIIAIFLLVGGLFLLNANWFSPLLQFSLIFSGFFGLFIFGTLLSYYHYKSLQTREVWNIE